MDKSLNDSMDSYEYMNVIVPMLKAYPNMNITQLGMAVLYVGSIRSAMGHEGAASTVRDYIHKAGLNPDIALCIEFLEREVLCLSKSKVDIDYWKRGNKGEFRAV